MSTGAVLITLVVLLMIGIVALLLWSTARSIRHERTPGVSVWRQFGLSLLLMILFFASWIGQAITQWQVFTDEQRAHGQEVAIGDFMAEFGTSTLENWQSEFLQLFSFVTLAALFIHRGSAESKDGTDRIEEMVKEIKAKLDA
jgi:hypothetical protein